MTHNWDLLDLWWCRGGRADDIDHTEENWRKMRRWRLKRLKRRARVEQSRFDNGMDYEKYSVSAARMRHAMARYEEVAGSRAMSRVMRRIWKISPYGITQSTAKPSQQNLDL